MTMQDKLNEWYSNRKKTIEKIANENKHLDFNDLSELILNSEEFHKYSGGTKQGIKSGINKTLRSIGYQS